LSFVGLEAENFVTCIQLVALRLEAENCY